VGLSNFTPNIPVGDNATVMIDIIDSPRPKFEFDQLEVAEGDEGNIIVRLSRALTDTIEVSWNMQPGSAQAAIDYDDMPQGTLTFNAGEKKANQVIRVQTFKTGPYKSDKGFRLELVTENANIIGNSSAIVTINTTDSKPVLQVSADNTMITEGDIASFKVSLSRPSVEDVTGKLIITSNSAVADEDYNFITSDIFTIAAGETNQTVEVKTLTTGSYRVEKSLSASLSSSADNIRIGGNNSTDVVINTTDSKPELSFVADSVDVAEGDIASFTVSLSRPSVENVTGKLIITSDSVLAGEDYNFITSDIFTIAAGETSQTVEVKTLITGSYRVEKSLKASLSSSADNIRIGGNNSTDVVINTTDSPKPELIVENTTVDEGDKTDVTVRLTRAFSEDIAVSWITIDDTATSDRDVDYEYSYGNLSFEANTKDAGHNIEVQTYKNGPYKPNKQFYIKLYPSDTHLDIEELIVTIDVTNSRPKISFVGSHVEVKEGETVNLGVGLSRPSSETVTVTFKTIDDTAEESTHYNLAEGTTLNFAENETHKSIEVTALIPSVYQPNDKLFSIELSNAENATISDTNNTAIVTISEPDLPKLYFLANSVSVTQGETVNLQVGLSRPSEERVSLDYEIIGNSGLLEDTQMTGTLIFAAKQIEQTIEVTTLTASVDQFSDKTLLVKLSNVDNATISDNSATVTITPILPEAANLGISFTKANTFSFSWDESPRATYYKLFEALDGALDFTEVDEAINITNTTYDHIVPLYKRVNARYKLQSCNQAGCSELSENVSISEMLDKITSSIGVINNEIDNYDHNELFGSAVSLSDDGETIAVGAYKDSSNKTGVTNSDGQQAIDGAQNQDGATASGAVYIYKRDEDNTWAIEAYIKAGNADAGDYFGHSISLSTDGNTLAVGAYMEDASAVGVHDHPVNNNDAEYSGAVYIYKRDEKNKWSSQAYIKASNAEAGDYFGESVSLGANGTTLAVGAYGEDAQRVVGTDDDYDLEADNNEKNSGATYVFTATNDGWIQEAYIKASTTGMSDYFGHSISLSADGKTLAVGAYQEDSFAKGINGNQRNDIIENSGAVFVFIRDQGDWPQQAYIKASNTDQNDQFGDSISLSADGNTLAVNAYREDSDSKGINNNADDNNNAGDSGAVYVFRRDTGWEDATYQDNQSPWAQQAYIKASNAGSSDWFGNRLSLSGDGNTLAVSAKNEDNTLKGIISGNDFAEDNDLNCCSNSGAVYIFTRDDSIWLEKTYIKAKNPVSNDQFGESVTLSGNGNTLVVGSAANASSDSFDKVYIY
ncbi:hypothetical protein N9I73_00685, partial [Porticoccaceae bacterium]|nr:hypothetical protein [Porticoccaceae bacterium]